MMIQKMVNKMHTEEERSVARAIGQFYLQKHKGDHKTAKSELLNLLITTIKIKDDNTVSVVLGCPGKFIGRRGNNIEELTKFLNRKIYIIEDTDPIYANLIPSIYEEF